MTTISSERTVSKDFDLDTFLQSYRPKSLQKSLMPYTKNPKLRGYTLLTKDAFSSLTPGKDYIKYIPFREAFSDEEYGEHIRSAGIFLYGGFFVYRKFIESSNTSEWTHIMMTFSEETDENTRVKRYMKLRLERNYIFYKKGVSKK